MLGSMLSIVSVQVAYSPEKLEEFRGKADKAVDFAGSSEPVEKESVSACSAA